MNFFICNRYDSKKENIYIISPKSPITKDNLKLLKYPFLKSLLIEDIHNINNNDISQNVQNSDNSEQLEIIEYPYSPSQSNNILENHFVNKYEESNSSIDNESSLYNCFNWDKIEEKNQIKINKKRKINEMNKINNNNISKTSLNINNKNKFKLNDSEIDVDDTIKGEDNFNITKLKSMNKNIGIKRKTNINLIPKDIKLKKISNLNKLPLNNLNISNINNIKHTNNNTFSIKRNSNKNKFINSDLKIKTTNNTLRYNNINTNFNIN